MSIERPKLRVKFEGFWNRFDLALFQKLYPFFAQRCQLVESDKPQLYVASVFGDSCYRENAIQHGRDAKRRWPSAVRLFVTGENVAPPLDDFEFAVTFYRDVNSSRHLRWPWFIPHMRANDLGLDSLIQLQQADYKSRRRDKFCAFIASNGYSEQRVEFVRRLLEYKHVDCPGAVLNNMTSEVLGQIGGLRGARGKISFLKDYKFAVCFENDSTQQAEGYVTEKLVDAMLAGCIPLYWGDRRVGEDFNAKSFVHFLGNDVDEMVEQVKELDRNDVHCERISLAPWFASNAVPAQFDDEVASRFFNRVIAATTA